MISAALMSLVLPGSGEALAGRWGWACFAFACALGAWVGGSAGLIVWAHVGSAVAAACFAGVLRELN
jgi:hypothetical protein